MAVSAPARTNERSGSRCSSSGVGRQMRIASQSARSAASVVARTRPALDQRRERVGRHVLDVRAARADGLDLGRVDVEPDDVRAGLRERDRERQPDVAETDDADPLGRRARDRGVQLAVTARRL